MKNTHHEEEFPKLSNGNEFLRAGVSGLHSRNIAIDINIIELALVFIRLRLFTTRSSAEVFVLPGGPIEI